MAFKLKQPGQDIDIDVYIDINGLLNPFLAN